MTVEHVWALPTAAAPWAWGLYAESLLQQGCFSVPSTVPLCVSVGRLVSPPHLHQLQQRVPQVPPRHEGYVPR